MDISKFSHGGNLWQVAQIYNILPENIIDFSANMNPWGNTLGIDEAIQKSLGDIFCYPDPECRRLTSMLSEYLGVDYHSILVGSGATEIIDLTMRAIKPSCALIPTPTFSEYERALKVAGGEPKFLYLKEDNDFALDIDELIEEIRGVEMVVLCNPNNPTGKLLTYDKVQEVADKTEKMGIYLLVDESFIDFQPQHSIVDKIKSNHNLLVMRSFTKLFSIAGLRLGYGVGGKKLIMKMKKIKQPWTVNSLAQVAGVYILKNIEKAYKLKKRIEREREFLYEKLSKIKGLKPYPSWANFILVKIETSFSSSVLTHRLAKRGILVRDCSNFPGLSNKFIRVAVRKREENEKLLYHLSQVLGDKVDFTNTCSFSS